MACLRTELTIRVLPEPLTAPKFLDDWMHIVTCQIIFLSSTLMQLLFPGDDNISSLEVKTS